MTQHEIESRGCRVQRVGQCWRISAPGVSILVADLRLIRPRDLEPVREQQERACDELAR